MIQSIPHDVQEYFASGPFKLLSIIPNNDYSLLLHYSDGTTRKYDMSEKLFGVFEILKDLDKFATVFIDEDGNIAWDKDPDIDSSLIWNNRIDICSDSAYLNSNPCD